MDFLSIVASVTKKRPIASTRLTEAITLAPIAHEDVFAGTIFAVAETNDQTGPTIPLTLDSSMGVALTNGISVVYANAIILGVENGNEIHFTMVVDGADLRAALAATTADWIEACLEVRAGAEGQDQLLLREPIIIWKTASGTGSLGLIPSTVPGVIFNWLLTAATDIDNIPATSLATMTLLITAYDVNGVRQQSTWQLLTGAYDAGDPDGSRPANTGRHWQKIG